MCGRYVPDEPAMNPTGKLKLFVWLVLFALAGTVLAGAAASQGGSQIHPVTLHAPAGDTRILPELQAGSYYLCDCDITNYWCRHCCRTPGDVYCPHGRACILFGLCYKVN